MKIIHTYCLNYNLGDHALGIGMKNLLREFLDVDLIAETNLQGTVFNEYYIDNVVNKNYDLLVIGGGGIIHGAHWPNGWFWLIKEHLIDRIQIPFIVYGAGYNYFEDEQGIPEVGRKHLLKTIEKSSFFSVRNDNSLERFHNQLNIGVDEVPDPGFHVNLTRDHKRPVEKPFIVVQLANDKPINRFGSLENRQLFVENLRESLAELCKKYKIIFAPHVYDDIALSQSICNGLDNAEVWDFSAYAFDNCRDCLAYYQHAEFVIAMRGHGQILPIAYNTPVISLENHPKHSGLMRKLGLEQYNVSVKGTRLSERLLKKADMLESNIDSYRKKLQQINDELYLWSERSLNTIKKLVDK